MSGHIGEPVAALQGHSQLRQSSILGMLKGHKVTAFELDTDGKIIAALTPMKARHAGMPGARIGRNELYYLAIAPNQEMRRYPQGAQLIKIRVGIEIERIAEQRLDKRPAELAWRQTDIVNDQQLGRHLDGTGIHIRRRLTSRLPAPAVIIDLKSRNSSAGCRHISVRPDADAHHCRTPGLPDC